jgi:hypothetical protein
MAKGTSEVTALSTRTSDAINATEFAISAFAEFAPLLKELNRPTNEMLAEAVLHMVAYESEVFPTPENQPTASTLLRKYGPDMITNKVKGLTGLVDIALSTGLIQPEHVDVVVKNPQIVVEGVSTLLNKVKGDASAEPMTIDNNKE